MALNFTVSYTFSPNTTIQSSQVNTNTSDVANVFTGLEALTKTWAKLKVDVDPATALEVATKQYVDHYSAYRRPVLQYSSGTVVNIETGINGTSGQAQILFPDGNLRTDSTSGRINCNLAQVAALSGSAQSGLFSGAAVANTWYGFFAVKTSDNSSNFVTVALAQSIIQANFATFNADFGTNSWVYLGTLPYGDNSGATTAIPIFKMSGNKVSFYNNSTGNAFQSRGVRLTTTAAGTGLTFTYASGNNLATPQIPSHFSLGSYNGVFANSTQLDIEDSAGTIFVARFSGALAAEGISFPVFDVPLAMGLKLTPNNSQALDIFLTSYIDGALGVGSNPLL